MLRLLFLIPAGFLASSIPAQATEFFAEHDGWTVLQSDDACSMTMDYEGPGATQLFLMKDLDNKIKVFIGNYGWSAQKDQEYEMSYLLNGTAYLGTAIGFKSGIKSGFLASFDEKFGRDFAQGQSLLVYMGDTLVDDLSLSGTAKAMSLVDLCLGKLRTAIKVKERDEARLAHIPKDPFASGSSTRLAEREKVVPQAPIPKNLNSWMQRIQESYPSEALRNEWQGRVGITVKVDNYGRASECSVTATSGHPVLDQAACDGFRRYGRFNPAIDEYGDVTEGYYSTVVNYFFK